ncbi:hypothetical protein N9H09_02085 [bacterium]|nr:hypothetical protein [bacterium]
MRKQQQQILIHFCKDKYRDKMTIKERAKLMIELFEALGNDWYEEKNKEDGINRAIQDLEYFDLQCV